MGILLALMVPALPAAPVAVEPPAPRERLVVAIPDYLQTNDVVSAKRSMTETLLAAGVVPVVLPEMDDAAADRVLSFCDAVLVGGGIAMQDYDRRCAIGSYSPLFDPVLKKPGKAFYALKYFNALYRLGRAVKCEVEGGQGEGGLWAVAAKSDGTTTPRRRATAGAPSPRRPSSAAFLVNDSPVARPVAFNFGGRKPKSCRIVDASRTDVEIAFPSTLPPHSFLLVEFDCT